MENTPGSVINQPERLKRLESPFPPFLCGVAAGRCSSYLDSLATDATHVLPLLLFFFSLHFFLSTFFFFFPLFHEREKISILRSGLESKSAHGRTRVWPTFALATIGGVYEVLSLCKRWICRTTRARGKPSCLLISRIGGILAVFAFFVVDFARCSEFEMVEFLEWFDNFPISWEYSFPASWTDLKY